MEQRQGLRVGGAICVGWFRGRVCRPAPAGSKAVTRALGGAAVDDKERTLMIGRLFSGHVDATRDLGFLQVRCRRLAQAGRKGLAAVEAAGDAGVAGADLGKALDEYPSGDELAAAVEAVRACEERIVEIERDIRDIGYGAYIDRYYANRKREEEGRLRVA